MRRALPHPGTLVGLAILALIVGAFSALMSVAGDRSTLLSIGPYLGRVLGFSAAQATISTALSLLLGVMLALALARRRFPGRGLAIAALGAAAVMPAIVVVFAILAVYGRAGWLAALLSTFGFPYELQIFGWSGILLAHVFLNAPLVARVTMDGLASAPAEHWRLAEALGFSPAQVWRHIDVPILRAELPGVASLVFLLCFTSFAIVLALGGGPSRATLEVAIYEALKLDLDFQRAAWLAFVQIGICLLLSVFLHWVVERAPVSYTSRGTIPRPDTAHRGLFAIDLVVLAAAALFLVPPLLSVLTGLANLPQVIDADLGRALLTSIAIATAAAVIACSLALALASAARHLRLERRQFGLAAIYDFLPAGMLAVPPFALVAGLFLMVRQFMNPTSAGYLLLPLMNGLSALPFAYSFMNPKLMHSGERYGRLAAQWGLTGWMKLRVVDWPLLSRPFGAAFALSMALSFGDFGVVALFGGAELRTLPYLLYERMGSYRIAEASAVGCVIVLVAFALAYIASRFVHADR